MSILKAFWPQLPWSPVRAASGSLRVLTSRFLRGGRSWLPVPLRLRLRFTFRSYARPAKEPAQSRCTSVARGQQAVVHRSNSGGSGRLQTFAGRHHLVETGHACLCKTGMPCLYKTGMPCLYKTGMPCLYKTGMPCLYKTGMPCLYGRIGKTLCW